MPTKSFALEAGGPRRLEVAWKGLLYNNMSVSLDGTLVDEIANTRHLGTGEEFHLPDGSTITVLLVNKWFWNELQVLRNGQPMPGSAADPETMLRYAYLVVYLVGCLDVLLGLAALLLHVQVLQQLRIGVGSILFGLVLLGLGFFVQRRSDFALIVAIVIFIVDGISSVLFSFATPLDRSLADVQVVMRLLVLIPMVQGVQAIKLLKSRSDVPPHAPA